MKNRWYNQFEFYETPAAFTRFLFETVHIYGMCFEPCAGSGAIIRDAGDIGVSGQNRTRVWATNDIDPRWGTPSRRDATEPDLWRNRDIDWTVSNTAFSIFTGVAEHALEHSTGGVALYGRLSIHEPLKTGVRRDFFVRHPPSTVIVLPRAAYRRSPKTGKWTTDSMTACWVVWEKSYLAQGKQRIIYAPPRVAEELEAETAAYRRRMDRLVGKRYRKPKKAA